MLMDLWPGNIKPGVFILVVITSPEIALSLVTPGGGFELNLVREVRIAVLHHIPPERRDFLCQQTDRLTGNVLHLISWKNDQIE